MASEGLSPWAAWGEVLARAEAKHGGKKLKAATVLGGSHLTAKMCYEAWAAGAPRSIIPTELQWDAATLGWRQLTDALNATDGHHSFLKADPWLIKLWQLAKDTTAVPTDAQLLTLRTSMPVMPLFRKWHTGAGETVSGGPTLPSMHRVFNEVMKKDLNQYDELEDLLRDVDQVYQRFNTDYGDLAEFDYRLVSHAFRDWVNEWQVAP